MVAIPRANRHENITVNMTSMGFSLSIFLKINDLWVCVKQKFSFLPILNQSLPSLCIFSKPILFNDEKFFFWKVLCEAFNLGFAFGVHVAFHFNPIVGSSGIDDFEVWLITYASSFDTFKPKRLWLVFPALYYIIFLLPGQGKGEVEFPFGSKVNGLPIDFSPSG